MIRAHVDVIAHALAFGLTRVAHLSLLGFDAHNAGWDALGFGGDAHENLSHVSGYTAERATEAVRAVTKFKAGEIAYLMQRLQETAVGGRTLADSTVLLWVNSGGGKHHDGAGTHAAVLVGDGAGKLKTGRYLELPHQKHFISQVFLAVGQAAGVKADSFGDPKHCPGPLPALV